MSSNTHFTNPPPPINLPNMSVPPPVAPNLSAPPPSLTMINTLTYQTRYSNHREANRNFFKPFRPYHAPKLNSGSQEVLQDEFDGKRLRKSVMRKTVDYNSAIIKTLENRIWQRDYRDRRALEPDVIYYPDLLPPPSYIDNPINSVTTKFVKTATNKMRCPIFCMAWTPEGRRLVTGASSGEFTLWNGLTFNFETILQAHDSPVRTMIWSHNESWMITGDHAGYVKYWQSNMNNVKMFQAHKEAIRGLSFSPTDHKLATCSDDGTVRIWDFLRCHEERILRGHGADVKCVHWHPQKSLVISGSKDNQQPIKLWDPKCGYSLATLHAHKSTVMDVKWNENGNWLVTASRDHLLKLFDLRNLNQEVQTFRGHKKEASSVAWHPNHEGLFCSGGSDGAILFWHVGADKEVGAIEQAHDSIVWTLAWHPLGHILCSGSNDHTSKFWTRNRPGDLMRDKYNLNTLPAGSGGVDDHEIADEASIIPGMGPEDRISVDSELDEKNREIPGLDLDHTIDDSKKVANKKVPYSKPIPRNFQAQWNEMEAEDLEQVEALNAIVNQLIETTPGAVPLNDVTPNAIILYGKMIPVEPGSKLAEAISKGADAINKLVQSGEIEQLQDIIESQERDESEDYLQDDSDIDFSKIPDIELPAPLASSKFAQNSELLKALNRGGKRKFDQLIGWTDGSSDRTSKLHQPVFSGAIIEDSQSNDSDFKYNSTSMDIPFSKVKFNEAYEDSRRKSLPLSSVNLYAAEDHFVLRSSSGSEMLFSSGEEQHVGIGFDTNNFKRLQNCYGDIDVCNDGGINHKLHREEKCVDLRKTDNILQAGIDKNDENGINTYNRSSSIPATSHQNIQNIHSNMPPPNSQLQSSISQNSSKISSQLRLEGSISNLLPHHNVTFNHSNSSTSQSSNSFTSANFRNSTDNNYSFNTHFRNISQFSNQNLFNNCSGPPPIFKSTNSNFDRSNFVGSNFRIQNPIPQSLGNNNFNSNFSSYLNKNVPSRSGQINHISIDNNRLSFNNRGHGRDNDVLKPPRGRDNY